MDNADASEQVQPITTTLEWHRTAEKLPDDGILVLVSTDGDVTSCFLEGTQWRLPDAFPVGAPDFWAHFPAGPEVAS
jgi:hypothetical protein